MRNLELADLLDLLHFYYEKDFTPTWEKELEYKSKFRQVFYPAIYETEYKYTLKESEEFGDSDPYTAPPEGTVKPYIPPTSQEELQTMLGPPMGE